MPDTGFRFGVSQYTTQQWTFEQDIEAYAALGVDCVEVCEFKLDAGRLDEQMALVGEKGLSDQFGAVGGAYAVPGLAVRHADGPARNGRR